MGGNQLNNLENWLEMVKQLQTCVDWPADEGKIEMIQTHISVVLMGQHHVIKLKKPVDYGFLDYTTLEKRLSACETEVSLNRRLCDDTYVGVQPVTVIEGKPRLSGMGHILDYGVRMKRLPTEGMLDQMIRDNTVTEGVIGRIADKLARFHETARRGADVDKYGSLELIQQNWEENFTQTAPFISRTLTQADFDALAWWVRDWIKRNQKLLESRVAGKRICDGHGDLRSESICVTNGICFFDCIEFNERFRCSDIASEAAFLAMDLDARGRPDLSYYFFERYEARTKDTDLIELFPFYRCYRAYVRGKVLSFRLDGPGFSELDKQSAQLRAQNFFELSRRYADRLQRPAVIIVTGLSGTGKTTVARSVAGELGLRVISADAVRRKIFGRTKGFAYGDGAYTAEANAKTYSQMFDEARTALQKEGGVVLDATFRRAADRSKARELAASLGVNWRIIECRLAEELVRVRLEQRAMRDEGISAATWDTFVKQRNEFEPINELPDSHLVLDTAGTLSSIARQATDWLRKVSAS